MRNLILSVLSVCLLTGINATAATYDFVVDDIYYTITDDSLMTVSTSYASKKYNSYSAESVTVPSTVT